MDDSGQRIYAEKEKEFYNWFSRKKQPISLCAPHSDLRRTPQCKIAGSYSSADNLPSRGKLSEMRPREESKRELLIDNAVRFYGIAKFANVITIVEL